MTYSDLKEIINEEYANLCSDVIKVETLGANDLYSRRQLYFIKAIYKVLMRQQGDVAVDYLTKEQIQNCIKLFNKYSGSTVQIEYT